MTTTEYGVAGIMSNAHGWTSGKTREDVEQARGLRCDEARSTCPANFFSASGFAKPQVQAPNFLRSAAHGIIVGFSLQIT